MKHLQAARQISKDVSHVRLPALPDSNVDSEPGDVAAQALERARLLDTATREQALEQLGQVLGETEVSRRITTIVHNADRAVEILSLVGYSTLRHLRSQGFSLHKIANDLRLNVSHVAAFMAATPTSATDAVADDEAFADALAYQLYEEMEKAMTDPKMTRNHLELFKVRKDLLIEMAKRSSHRWANRPVDETKVMPTLHIDLSHSQPTAEAEAPKVVKPVEEAQIVDDIPEINALEFD